MNALFYAYNVLWKVKKIILQESFASVKCKLQCSHFEKPFVSIDFSSVQSLSRVWLCDPMDCSMSGLPVHHQLPEFTQTHVHWVGDAIQPSHPPSSPSPPAFSLSQHQGLFQWISSWNQVAKYWSFSFNISPSNEYSGLISFRMDWLDLLAVDLRWINAHSVAKQFYA